MTTNRSITLSCPSCGGTPFVQGLADTFSCPRCGRAARAAVVARRAVAPNSTSMGIHLLRPYSAPYSA